MDNEIFKQGLSELIEKRIDFYDLSQKKEHLLECIEYLFNYKETGISKNIFINSFKEVRDNVVFCKIPHFYINEESGELEDIHTDFVNELDEIVLDFGPPPYFWNSTKVFFLSSIKV